MAFFAEYSTFFKKNEDEKNERKLSVFGKFFSPKGTVGVFSNPLPLPRGFWLMTSEVESFSTRDFVTFPNIKCRIRTK